MILAIVTLGSGCAGVASSSGPASLLRLELVNSPLVLVSRAWLEQQDGRWFVRRAYAPPVPDARHHRHPSGRHASGLRWHGLVVEHGGVFPRQIPRRPKLPDSANFLIALPPVPPMAQVLVVRAHEGEAH